MKLFDKIYIFILFIQFSETYRVITWLFHLPKIIISSSLLLFNLIYILANVKRLQAFSKNKLFIKWLFLLLVLPSLFMMCSLLFSFMSLSDYGYWMLFNFLYVSAFIGASVFAFNVPTKSLTNLCVCCIISTIIGFILNYTYFDLFRVMGELSNNSRAYVVYGGGLERGISFFAHGNRAAFSIICFFTLFAGLKLLKRISSYVVLLLLLFAMIFTTGSRTSLLLTLFIAGIYYTQSFASTLKKKYRLSSLSVQSILFLFSLIAIVLIVVSLSVVSDILIQSGNTVLGNRLDLIDLFSATGNIQDRSLSTRLTNIGVYWEYIKQNPVFGYGPAYLHAKQSIDDIEGDSQNAYLMYSFYYGIPYTLYYVYVLASSYFYKSRILFKNYSFNMMKAFTVFFFLLGFSVSHLFWNNALVLSAGFILGLLIKDTWEKKDTGITYKGIFFNSKETVTTLIPSLDLKDG